MCKPPFEGKTIEEYKKNVVKVAKKEFNEDVPEFVKEIVTDCLIF
jgi:hypothetical protein